MDTTEHTGKGFKAADVRERASESCTEAVRRKNIDPKKLVIYSEIMKPKFDE